MLKSNHIELAKAATISLYPVVKCITCEKELWERCSSETRYQVWWFTRENKRHFKTRCNLTIKKVY